MPWIKAPSQAFTALAQPDVSLLGFGSFVSAHQELFVEYSCATLFATLPGDEVLLGGAVSTTSMQTAAQLPVALAPRVSGAKPADSTADPTIAPSGANIIRDPVTRRQYLVVIATNPEVIVTPTAKPDVVVYRAVVA